MKTFSSDLKFDMDKEYMLAAYSRLNLENDPVYGVADSSEVVIRPTYFDELMYMFMAKGTHLVLFGGPWSQKMQDVIARVNFLARKYGVDTVYTFDFRADSISEDTDIKVDLTYQASYDGPEKKKPLAMAERNYFYGEMVTRHLPNLNDWVKSTIGSEDDITYLNLYQDAVTVPNLHEPFLFLYNKDNRTDNSGAGSGKEGTYPIIAALELEPEMSDEEIENGVFRYIGKDGNDITPYSHADYMFDAFSMNQRGHCFKTENAFKKDEQINIQPITLQEFLWLLDQPGSYMIMFGGSWCACTQSAVATVNDFAVANGARVYLIDIRLDGKHAIDFWQYPRVNEFTMSSPAILKYYVDIWEGHLPGAPIMTSINPEWVKKKGKLGVLQNYTDENGEVHTVLSVGVPYILAYNKDHVGRDGRWNPVLASRHDAGELINTSDAFIYYDPNYRDFTGSMYKVFYAYCESLGRKMKDITIDRRAPIVDGPRVRHPATVEYHKEHDWYKERAGIHKKAAAAAEPVDEC